MMGKRVLVVTTRRETGLERGNSVVNDLSTKVTKQLSHTGSLQTLAKGDKLTVTVERIDGGKLRCTGATSSGAVVIYPGEILAFQNIERQAHALRAPAPGREPPAIVRMISGPLDDRGVEWRGEKAVDLVTGVLPKGWALGYSLRVG
jgi:hypothetical protein